METTEYLLRSGGAVPAEPADIHVEHLSVRVAAYLDRAGIVVETSGREIREARQHIWAERFDEDMDDIFELQENIARAIAANIDSRLKYTERERARLSAEDLDIWEKFQGALWHFFRSSEAHAEEARRRLGPGRRAVPCHGGAGGRR